MEVEVNKFYKGDISPDEIKYRIENDAIAGFSIEYNNNEDNTRTVNHNGEDFRFIEELTDFSGIGFARARRIANPHAVIYKEIEDKIKNKEVINMTGNEKTKEEVPKVEEKTPEPEAPKVEEKVEESKTEPEVKETISVKEILESKEFNAKIDEVLEVKSKVIKKNDGGEKPMDQVQLCVKEMKESFNKRDMVSYTEAGMRYIQEKETELMSQFKTTGIPLNTTIQTKCINRTNGAFGMGKLQIKSTLQTKDTLDTTTNPSSYQQSPVEFADVYVPGLVDTFNNQISFFGALPKKDNIVGGMYYGWKMKVAQDSGFSVDPNDTAVIKYPVEKENYRTQIKVYRPGISVTDYTLHHSSRASLGDLFQGEVDSVMGDLMKDINKNLFQGNADATNNKVLGLLAVADSATYTELYGYTRTAANRLSPDSAAETYENTARPIAATAIRYALRRPEIEGSMRSNLRIIVGPKQRDQIFNLEDTAIRYKNDPNFGFFGNPAYDGVPIIVDVDCPNDQMIVSDFESNYIVVSKGPTLTGLAKVGAAKEAYIEIYLAHVYEQPRRIFIEDGLK